MLSVAMSLWVQAAPVAVPENPCAWSDDRLEQATSKGPPGDSGYFGVMIFSATQPFCGGWTAITVFRDQHSHWALRRTINGADPTELPVESWAYSARCPKMLDALDQLDHMSIRFGIGPVRPIPKDRRGRVTPPPLLHGTYYSIRDYGGIRQSDGRYASLRLSSNEGAIAAWGRMLLSVTAPCWTATSPRSD